jgi:hypothetical protein
MNDFQRMAVKQGAGFEKECGMALTCAGFEIVYVQKHLDDVGITLDAVTNNKKGVPMAWEFKGSLQGHRPGLIRTDTVKKAICNAWLFSKSQYAELFPPLFFMCSHEPERGDARRMLDTALNDRMIAAVINSRNGLFLIKLANATADEVSSLIARHDHAPLEIPVKKATKTEKRRRPVSKAQLGIQFNT